MVFCSLHQKSIVDCFDEHHKAEVPTLGIVLPCNHLVDRPTRIFSVIQCACGRQWQIKQDLGNKSWDASEIK